MNYKELLDQSRNCPKCCKEALERYMKNQKDTAKPTDKKKKNTSKG